MVNRPFTPRRHGRLEAARSGQPLRLVLAQEALEQAAVALLVRVDRVGRVAHHGLDLHPVGLGEQLDELLPALRHLLAQDSFACPALGSHVFPVPRWGGGETTQARPYTGTAAPLTGADSSDT